MKRIFLLVVSLMLALSLVSCGSPEESPSESATESLSESVGESLSESLSESGQRGEVETGADNEVDAGDFFEGTAF